MIRLKSAAEIAKMKKSCEIIRDLLLFMEEKVRPGITTKKLDEFAYDYIKRKGATPSFLGYGGFPGSICASIDEVVVHGIPSSRRLEEGQIIGIDVGAILGGWQSDAARTFIVGDTTPEKKKLVEVTKESFFKGVEQFKLGNRLGDISHAIQEYAEGHGFGVVRAMVGHGIGREMHEDPSVPNYGKLGTGMRLKAGTVLCIEPMITMGSWKVNVLRDGWTAVTVDGKPAAHYENTVVVREDGVEILTL